jgi:hypothetical protein
MDFSAPGVYALEYNLTYGVDFDGDGTFGTIALWVEKGYEGVWIYHNGAQVDLAGEAAVSHIVRRENGRAALIVWADAYDYPHTYIYTPQAGTLALNDYIGLKITDLGVDRMSMDGNIYYFLGNQFLSGEVGLSDDFKIIWPEDGFFDVAIHAYTLYYEYDEHDGTISWETAEKFEDSDGFIYTVNMDLRFKRLVDGGYVYDTLPAGTRIRPLKMNRELTRAVVEDLDGKLWLLEREDGRYIGYSDFLEAQLFNGCTYAGP